MKRLGTMLLAVLMLVSLLPMYAVAEQRDVDLSGTFGDIVWTLTGSTYEVENEYGEIVSIRKSPKKQSPFDLACFFLTISLYSSDKNIMILR